MTSLTLELRREGRSTPSRWRSRVKSAALIPVKALRAAAAPHTASLARLWDMPLTVLGTAGVDFSAFHVNHGIGWLITGLSLVVIEHLISDPPDGTA